MNKAPASFANGPAGWFADLAPSPENHFRLHFYGAVLAVIEKLCTVLGSFELAIQQFPFLAGYHQELVRRATERNPGGSLENWWSKVVEWEGGTTRHLPLRALRTALRLEPEAFGWLVTVGLIEEDGRFGGLFDLMQSSAGLHRPTLGALRRCWEDFCPRASIHEWFPRFVRTGLVRVLNPEVGRTEWALQVHPLLWEALRGGSMDFRDDGLNVRPVRELPDLDDLVLPADLHPQVAALPALIQSGQVRTLIIRGPNHNGRRTLLQAVARGLGRDVVELRVSGRPDLDRWKVAVALAVIRSAMLIVEVEAGPGESVTLPDLEFSNVVVGCILGKQMGLSGDIAQSAIRFDLGLPDLESRQRLWLQFPAAVTQAWQFGEQYRMASGILVRTAKTAEAQARLAGRDRLEATDVQQARRDMGSQSLQSLARLVPLNGNLDQLCAAPRTWRELEHLERRCRHRERVGLTLQATPDGARNIGVRALFHGPSGTGKTLAARLLAGSIHKDLFQLDLSTVVNKYIGETEKNLNRAFELAEELDVILLLDEGDALLTRRTDVQSANDRYANLETNFLLQRLECYEGIVLVTTNTRDRIDPAFERRMDVVVEFLPPDATERWQLWQSHLPITRRVDDSWLSDLAGICELTGGQIRNASLHAALLALDNEGIVTTSHLDAAVRREYARLGAVCPLRTTAGFRAAA